MIICLILCNIKGVFEVENYDFQALIGKFLSWMEKVTSQAELKIVQLELWLEPARLELITTIYVC